MIDQFRYPLDPLHRRGQIAGDTSGHGCLQAGTARRARSHTATGYGFLVIDWTSPRFLDEADAWIRSQVHVVGEIEQPHVRPWSTVLRVPSDGEVLWFKAVSDGHAFEVPLTAILARLRPRHRSLLRWMSTAPGC